MHIFEIEIKQLIELIRPPVDLRDQLDIGYSFVDYTLEVFEIRPRFDNPAVYLNIPIVKTKYILSKSIWKIYWMRANGKWVSYQPHAECKTLKEFFVLLEEDKHGCFWG